MTVEPEVWGWFGEWWRTSVAWSSHRIRNKAGWL